MALRRAHPELDPFPGLDHARQRLKREVKSAEQLAKYTDKDMHDVFAYLETLK